MRLSCAFEVFEELKEGRKATWLLVEARRDSGHRAEAGSQKARCSEPLLDHDLRNSLDGALNTGILPLAGCYTRLR